MPLSANEDVVMKPVQKRLADCMLQLALQLQVEVTISFQLHRHCSFKPRPNSPNFHSTTLYINPVMLSSLEQCRTERGKTHPCDRFNLVIALASYLIPVGIFWLQCVCLKRNKCWVLRSTILTLIEFKSTKLDKARTALRHYTRWQNALDILLCSSVEWKVQSDWPRPYGCFKQVHMKHCVLWNHRELEFWECVYFILSH